MSFKRPCDPQKGRKNIGDLYVEKKTYHDPDNQRHWQRRTSDSDMLKILEKTHVTVFVYGNTESEFDRRRSRWNQLQRIRKDHD